ncbi:MAG: ComF family protein [Candidatus Berkelbacteria bacterium]|nr:ComF family protein [Candidatus Berkelbacteria bacterium]
MILSLSLLYSYKEMSSTKTAYNFVLDLIFPKICSGCGKFGEIVCADCQNQIKIIQTPTCPKCGKITPSGQFCKSCKDESLLTGLLISADYRRGPVKEMIHHLKYSGQRELALPLAKLLVSRLKISKLRGQIVVVPVPLHIHRQRLRGFNQSELLARAVCTKLNLAGANALKRIKFKKTQVESKGKERRENLIGAFKCVDGEIIKNKTIVLVDDVSTTGATLEECAKVLRLAGARQVWGLVVARG